MKTVTVTYHSYHHLPDDSDRPDLDGMTVRECLAALRTVRWGNIGGATVELSDGTIIDVELEPASDGNSWLMSSQRAVRREFRGGSPRVLRTYQVR